MHEVQRRADLTDRYESPSTAEEALAILARHRERARLIAGGTDLVLEIRRGVRSGVEILVDISRVGGLDRSNRTPRGSYTWDHL